MTVQQTIELFINYLEGNGRSPETVATYRRRLARFFATSQVNPAILLATITPETLDQWGGLIRGGNLAKATQLGYIQTIKTILAFAHRRGYIAQNPAQELERPRLDHNAAASGRVMASADLRAILAGLENSGNLRDLAIIMFMADTGARRGEVSRLKSDDLILPDCDAWVDGKTGRQMVDYTTTTREILILWLEQRPQVAHPYLFTGLGSPTSEPGDPLLPGAINLIMKRAARAAGIRGPHNPHSIRHLVGQTFTDHVNLELVRQKLRHSNIHTTAAFYAHQDRERVKAATTLYSPIASLEKVV
jgi:site-specific recombinase XerD